MQIANQLSASKTPVPSHRQSAKRSTTFVVRSQLEQVVPQNPKIIASSPIPISTPPPSQYSRSYKSVLPPFFERATAVEQYAEGLWGFVQPLDLKPLGLADIRLRMTVMQLTDGSLLLHNPVAPTEELLQQVKQLDAPVKHILLSSNSPEHWLYASAMCNAFPDATLWVVPGLFEPLLSKLLGPLGLNAMKDTAVPLGSQKSILDDEIKVIPFLNQFTLESAVILKRFKALLVSDAAIYLDIPDANALVRNGAKQAGVWQRLGPATQQLFEQYPEDGGKFVSSVLQEDIEFIVPAHGNAAVPNAKAAWKECFSFLKQ